MHGLFTREHSQHFEWMASCFRTSLACVDSDAPVKGCCEAVGWKGLARLEAKVTTKCDEVGDDEAGDISRVALRLRECEGKANSHLVIQ